MSKQYLDYKVTVWLRIPVSEEDKDKFLEDIQNDNFNCPAEIFNDSNYDPEPEEVLYETTEFITVDENNGSSTIEVVEKESGKTIWDNSFESEAKRKLENEN